MTNWTAFFIRAGLWAGVVLLMAWAAGTAGAWLLTKFMNSQLGG